MNRRKKKPTQHKDRLVPTPPGTPQLCFKVESQFLDLLESWLRIRGEEIAPPVDLNQDMLRWRRMAVRFKAGDFRSTLSELKSMEAIAEWSYRTNCVLRNQEQTL